MLERQTGAGSRRLEARQRHGLHRPANLSPEICSPVQEIAASAPTLSWSQRYPDWWPGVPDRHETKDAKASKGWRGNAHVRLSPEEVAAEDIFVKDSQLKLDHRRREVKEQLPQSQDSLHPDSPEKAYGTPDQVVLTATKGTQTVAPRLRRLRPEYMPCLQRGNRQPREQFKVAISTLKEEACRKQMGSLRRLGRSGCSSAKSEATPCKEVSAASDVLGIAERFLSGELCAFFMQEVPEIRKDFASAFDQDQVDIPTEEDQGKKSLSCNSCFEGWGTARRTSEKRLPYQPRFRSTSAFGERSSTPDDVNPSWMSAVLDPVQQLADEKVAAIAEQLGIVCADAPVMTKPPQQLGTSHNMLSTSLPACPSVMCHHTSG